MVLEISLVHIDFYRQWYIKTKTNKSLVLLNFSGNGISQDKTSIARINLIPSPHLAVVLLDNLVGDLVSLPCTVSGMLAPPRKKQALARPAKNGKSCGAEKFNFNTLNFRTVIS